MQNNLYINTEQYVGLSDAAKIVGKTPSALAHWVKQGRAPVAVELGGKRRWKVADLLAWQWIEKPRGRKK